MVAGTLEVTSDGHARASAPEKSVIKTTATATSVAAQMRRATPRSFCSIAPDLSNIMTIFSVSLAKIAVFGDSSLTQIKRSPADR
jgi:hypothetical protein